MRFSRVLSRPFATLSSSATLLVGNDILSQLKKESLDVLSNTLRSVEPESLPTSVYAICLNRFLNNGDFGESTRIALSNSKHSGDIIELTVKESESWATSWEWLKQLVNVEQVPVLRAFLDVASKTDNNEVRDEAIKHVLMVCNIHRHLASFVFRPVCALLPETRWEEGLEVLSWVQRSNTYFCPSDTDTLLDLLNRAKQHKRVLALWSSLKHTVAASSQNVVSEVIIALTNEGRSINDIALLMQHLAKKKFDPKETAQLAVMKLLYSYKKPLAAYASQLVEYWQNASPEHAVQLWLYVLLMRHKARQRDHFIEQTENLLSSQTLMSCFGPPEFIRLMPAFRSFSLFDIATKMAYELISFDFSHRQNRGDDDNEVHRASACCGCALAMNVINKDEKIFREACEKIVEIVYNNAANTDIGQKVDKDGLFSDIVSAMFSSLSGEEWTKGKEMAVGIAELLGMDVPADTQAWFALLSTSSPNDDVSSMLADIGVE